jgi:hypothetical protein
MILMRQGDIAGARKIAALEARIEALENMVKAIQGKNAKIGRPPKERCNDKENIGCIPNKEQANE